MQIGCVPGSKAGNSWARYGHGRPHDPAQAIPAAARYLVDHGARRNVDRAIFAYNHSWAYVARVKQLARRYARGGGRHDGHRRRYGPPVRVELLLSRSPPDCSVLDAYGSPARSPEVQSRPADSARGQKPPKPSRRTILPPNPHASEPRQAQRCDLDRPAGVQPARGWVYLLCFRDPHGQHAPQSTCPGQ